MGAQKIDVLFLCFSTLGTPAAIFNITEMKLKLKEILMSSKTKTNSYEF